MYKMRTLANMMRDGWSLEDAFAQIDALVASFPENLYGGNDLGSDEKWRRVMLQSPSSVFCLTFNGAVVGYWFCVIVTEDLYDRGIVGDNINSTLDLDDIQSFLFPGDYLAYFVDFFILKEHFSAGAAKRLHNSIIEYFKKAAKSGYFIERIFAHTGSFESKILCENAGFRFVTQHKEHLMKSRTGELVPSLIYEINLFEERGNKILSLDNELVAVYDRRRAKRNALNGPDAPQEMSNLISQGESEVLEFKASLKQREPSQRQDYMEFSCLKAICAFANHTGGTLIIGVDDAGNAVGLGADRFGSEDKMALHLINLIDSRIGRGLRPYISQSFDDYQGHRVLAVHCKASPVPAFVKDSNSEKFFVRGGVDRRALRN